MTGRWFDEVQIVVDRLGNWDGEDLLGDEDDPSLPETLAPPGAHVALVRNAYTPLELQQGGPAFLPDLEREFGHECAAKFGDVLAVAAVPDLLPGAVVLAFATRDAFDRCKAQMDGRWFDFRKLRVSLYHPPHPQQLPQQPPPPPNPDPPPSDQPSLDDFFRDIQANDND